MSCLVWCVHRYEEESETVDDSLMPDGLDEDMWARFQAYRGSRVGETPKNIKQCCAHR
jgi:hypothetical protein